MVEIKNKLVQQLQKLWSIESQLVEAMPRMIKKANNFGLKKTLAFHFEETRQHKVVLEALCKALDIDARAGEPDSGMQQLLQQGENEMIDAFSNDLDAVIITVAQKIETYEMAVYMPAAETASHLGLKGISGRLYLTFEEERQSETKLKFFEKELFAGRAEIGQQQVMNTER